ncbi:MAG: type II toxin-antitoxin system Phd/YefM family antitoxin, partial [Veillonella caviae]|nr:type II toxin-antitoxin system Phd/YefM family antitoxin [Veillonella caviae]
MGILRETIRPSSDLRNKYNEIASILRSSDKACIMTVNGRGDTVCMGYETYNKLKAQIELLEAIALSEEDEKSGRILDIQDTFDSIER